MVLKEKVKKIIIKLTSITNNPGSEMAPKLLIGDHHVGLDLPILFEHTMQIGLVVEVNLLKIGDDLSLSIMVHIRMVDRRCMRVFLS